TLVVLVVATYVIQLVLPRTRGGGARRTSARWDIAPVIGFFGILLLALSFTEALRRVVIEVWLVGLALGLVLSAFLWIALGSRETSAPRARGSALLATIRAIRTFGLPVLFALIGVYLAVRFIGAVVEVFVSGLLGAAILAMAVWIFLVGRQATKTG
ncbi:MAG: hypothetical protein AB1817_21915, partial [Chloroflexota bacterium]